ncbi:ankyrin repeat domain-containing protein [Wolbachia endosymbiont of Cylisticus convexus]|uniref:ankyrin repeat domain-containing protein n=1 Tax=Wolbachia endosymbiont of Cylisticus convexus TaxID=118728 RepID=UPI000DF70D7C|nr:ankyrin repeat domain-containing protein [Wolbachia endosymbiont of Cylisticus convexus]RDD34684.1 ankyrin repeat domain-containing protein [Wolbachia endosymbiont of Cylisticus convexus]
MLENKFSKVINHFKAKPSTSAKTLSAGLFTTVAPGMVRAVSKIDISILQGSSEDGVSKQDLISLYSKIAQEENYHIYTNNLDHIKSRISAENIRGLLAEKFRQDGWNITSNDGSSLLTVAIERIRERRNKNRDCDIHVQIAVSLILNMKRELIIGLENFADSNGKTLLHYLAESGKEDVLRLVIESSNFDIKEAVRSEDRGGKTPLHYAAKFGNEECFKTLMENEAHFTSTINHKSELHYAARSGNFSLLGYLEKVLTARGIFDREKIKKDRYGNNALHFAAQSENAECIKFFIDNRVKFLNNQYHENPLHKIAGNSETQDSETQDNAINFLIEHSKLLGQLKSDINQKDVDGNTPLHIAAQHGNKQLIELFSRLGAKIVKNKQDNTPLHIAIMHGNADCIELFHENREDILESKGEHGRNLVHLAAMYGQFDCLHFLLNEFPNHNLNTKTSKGNTALHLALLKSTELESRKQCVSLLIDRGMQVNESNNEGSTPLHFAAQLVGLEFLSVIEGELKKQKIDVHQEILRKNQSGNTAFHMAARVGNKSCLEHLFSLMKKEKIEEILRKENNDGQTLLHLSMLNGSMECVEYLAQESQKFDIDIFSEQNTQKKLLFAAALSGNKECLKFLVKSSVDGNMTDSIGMLFSHNDENGNTPLHMAALADGIGCSQYIIEGVSKLTRLDISSTTKIHLLFNTNIHGLTPLHLAAMSLNAEVIKYFMTDNYPYAEKTLNILSKSGRTSLHYLVMNGNDFERIVDEDFKQDCFLKSVVLEKRKQNEHFREKAINALFCLTMSGTKKVISEKIDFDIKDNAGKTALDYSLEYSDVSILRLFLDVFYEIKKDRKRKYDKFEIDYQEKQEMVSRITNVLTPIASITISSCVLSDQSESEVKKFFTYISITCSLISLAFFLSNLVVSRRKEPLKNDIKNYTEKIDRIEEITGKSAETKVEVHDFEGYSTIRNAEDISELKSTLNNFMNAVDLKNRDKPNMPSQNMSRHNSVAQCSDKSLTSRRNSSFLNDVTKKFGQYVRRNSRVQDTMDRCDSASCLITIEEHSKSKQEAPQSKLKVVINKLRAANTFRKKENVVDTSSLSESAAKRDEEEYGLIKRSADTHEYSIFSIPPNCSTSGEEFGTTNRAARRVSYGSVNKLPPVSENGASKFPSATLSNPEVEDAIKEADFLGVGYRPRVQSNPSYMTKKKVVGKLPKSRTSFDRIGKVKDSVFSTFSNSNCSTSIREEFGTAGTGNRTVHRMSYGSANKLFSVSEETLSSSVAEVAIKEADRFQEEYGRSRTYSSPVSMSGRETARRVLKSRISSNCRL